jgi:ethanolamine permease
LGVAIGGLISAAVLLLPALPTKSLSISVMGAIGMYMMSMVSLFMLRVKEPKLERPFTSPMYPAFPAIALTIFGFYLVCYHLF